MSETATEPESPKRRWPKRLAIVAAGAALLVLLLPTIAGTIAPSFVTRELEKRLDARVALGSLDLSYAGRASVEGFELTDPAGSRIARVERVDVDADVRNAIGGVYKATVDVDGFEVHVRRTADGSWNLLEVARPTDDEDDDDEEDDGASEKDAPPPVEALVRVKNGRVVVHGDDGTTELVDLSLTANVTDLAEPASFEVGLGLVGPGGPAGRLDVSGAVVPMKKEKSASPLATARVDV